MPAAASTWALGMCAFPITITLRTRKTGEYSKPIHPPTTTAPANRTRRILSRRRPSARRASAHLRLKRGSTGGPSNCWIGEVGSSLITLCRPQARHGCRRPRFAWLRRLLAPPFLAAFLPPFLAPPFLALAFPVPLSTDASSSVGSVVTSPAPIVRHRSPGPEHPP